MSKTHETPVQLPRRTAYVWTYERSHPALGHEPIRVRTPEQKRLKWGPWMEHKKLQEIRARMKNDDADD